MEEIERLYMVDAKDWVSSSKTTSADAQKLFKIPSKPIKTPELVKQAEPKPIEEAEAQPGNKNPPPKQPPVQD